MVSREFRFDRTWRFDVSVEELWEVLSRTEEYPRWWTWLDHFESEGLAPGAVSGFSVRPPLPYRLHLTLKVERSVPAELLEVTIGGDLSGAARLELSPRDDGCEVHMVWCLEVRRPWLREIERVARPAMIAGHDTIVALGVRQFRRRALGMTRRIVKPTACP